MVTAFFCGAILTKYLITITHNDFSLAELKNAFNALGPGTMWQPTSPIWYRPGENETKVWQGALQVVGHTPVEQITQIDNMIMCDVFSTYDSGEPIGTGEYLVLDTLTHEWIGMK